MKKGRMAQTKSVIVVKAKGKGVSFLTHPAELEDPPDEMYETRVNVCLGKQSPLMAGFQLDLIGLH